VVKGDRPPYAPRVEFRAPPSLRPGSLVAVVAPAGPFNREVLFPGLAWLRTRYRLRLSSRILSRSGYLAGDDARRAGELARAMADPEVEAIVCARGGYGVMRILDALPWEAFAARPKWIGGFSDITALHVEAAARGVCTLHAMNATGLGRRTTPLERLSFIDGLEGRALRPWTGLDVLHRGRSAGPFARGPLVGGNLALVVAMAAAGRLVVPAGAIVLLEDITERPFRVDRMLTSLRLGKYFARASAIVFGDFTQCEPKADGVTVAEVLRDRTADLGIPVLTGAPVGHGEVNRPFVLGAVATIEGTTLRFT
jgi:muramoyltetrapeptide carboxypeptidase